MKASEAKLLSLLQKSPQFVIQIYQRICNGDVEGGFGSLDALFNVLGVVRHHSEGQTGDGVQA